METNVEARNDEGLDMVEEDNVLLDEDEEDDEEDLEEDEEEEDEDDDEEDDGEELLTKRVKKRLAYRSFVMSGGRSWEQVKVNTHGFDFSPPGPRSLHIAVVYQQSMYMFGGYDGSGRVNEFHQFDFVNMTWHCLNNVEGVPPSPRDRHAGVVVDDYLLIFGGYDGFCRTNDLCIFDFTMNRWHQVEKASSDNCPSARHSHSAVAYDGKMYVFGGYDGAYKNDLYQFTLRPPSGSPSPSSRGGSTSGSLVSTEGSWGHWQKVAAQGRYPQARYRASCVVFESKMYLFGGHDGSRHLNDTHVFDFETFTWSSLHVSGPVPLPRDSHVALVYRDCMFIFGGSSGNAMNDFHYLTLRGDYYWSPVLTDGWFPCSRFCHVAVEYDNSMYVYGGYDGSLRLKDFQRFKFAPSVCRVERSMLLDDLATYVGNEILADVVFNVENMRIYAHRVLCMRCSSLLENEEDFPKDPLGRRVVEVENVEHEIFKTFLAYLYTDKVNLTSSALALKLYPLATRYKVDRLKTICLNSLSTSLTVKNASVIFQASDSYQIMELRERALAFILQNFDQISKTEAFEEMGRTNVELVFEILRKRGENNLPGMNSDSTPEMGITLASHAAHDVNGVLVDDASTTDKGRRWLAVQVHRTTRRGNNSINSVSSNNEIAQEGDVDVQLEISPGKRSLHVTAVHGDSYYVFGGYNGEKRVNDFYRFNFKTKKWSMVPISRHSEPPPSPRDRHTGVVIQNSFWVFGGYDGRTRVKELHAYNFRDQTWKHSNNALNAPSARHSHASVAVNDSMFVFGGYDGSYRNDLYEFSTVDFSWQKIHPTGRPPSPRYRTSLVSHQENLYIFAGHDGFRHLNDVYVYNMENNYWSLVNTLGPPPAPRDSHCAVVHGNHMYIFGGSSGNAMDDFYKLRLRTESAHWTKVHTIGMVPSPRFCHAAAVYNRTLYVYGGYDGSQRLCDFIEFGFAEAKISQVPRSGLVSDLAALVGNEHGSDVTFIVEGKRLPAHKILCLRCPYFRAMFSGGMRESTQDEITFHDIRYEVFHALLQYLYTDRHDIALDMAMDLFVCADRFGVERLKNMCENRMLNSIDIENVAEYFSASEYHNAQGLHERCMAFIVMNFDEVSKTQSFEEMGRSNVDLVFKILKSR